MRIRDAERQNAVDRVEEEFWRPKKLTATTNIARVRVSIFPRRLTLPPERDGTLSHPWITLTLPIFATSNSKPASQWVMPNLTAAPSL